MIVSVLLVLLISYGCCVLLNFLWFYAYICSEFHVLLVMFVLPIMFQGKHRNRIKEKLDKFNKEKLLDFCEILDIYVPKATTKKVSQLSPVYL